MYFLRNLLAAPLELVMGPKRFIEDMWLESDRSRALLLAFPSIFIGLFGVVVFALAQFGMQDLEAGYVAVMERVSEEREKLEIDMWDQQRMRQVADGVDATEDVADPQDETLKELREEESIYLNKLISMNKTEPEYRYRLAMAKLRTNPGHGISILKSLAPENEAGFSKAHRYLANYYASLRPSTNADAQRNAELALSHAEYCLKRDKGDSLAKAIKAQLLMNEGQLLEAERLFTELFEEEPSFYKQLMQINERMDRTDLNQSILERALLSFNEKLSREKLNARAWVNVWQQMIGCYVGLGDYREATQVLEAEMSRLSQGEASNAAPELQQTISSRQLFLKRLLADVYLRWTGKTVSRKSTDAADKLEALELAKQAYRLAPTNPAILQIITRMATDSDSEVADRAKEIYNPFEHYGAPSPVLNELGAAAMKREEFSAAVRFFELAKKKDPNNPMILNNLSYSWLRSEDQDANRALQLVDQGLRLIAGNPRWAKYRSNFLDTRGNALIQLGRYEEAIAAFEKALTSRPNDINLLRQLVECYRKTNLDPTILVNRIQRIEEKAE